MKPIYMLAASAAALCLVSCGTDTSAPAASGEAENAVIEAIMNRRSIRMYKDMPVEREKLRLIAECGVNAPNGMNSQPWELRIVDDIEMIDAISDSYRQDNPEAVERDPNFKNMFRNAPAVIFIAVPEGEDGLNAGLLGENICLSAYSLGLGTVCLGGPVGYLKNSEAGKAFLERLDFSEGYDLLFMIGVGYPDESPEAKPRDLSKIRFVD